MIITITALTGLAALAITSRMKPKYEASVTMLVEPSKDAKTSDYSALVAAERLALTYSEMITGRTMFNKMVSDLEFTVEELSEKITVQPVQDTQLIRLTVEDESPKHAAEIANHFAKIFLEYIDRKQSERYAGQKEEHQLQIASLTFRS